MPYNLVRKEVANPIACNGYSLFDDGKMIVFRAAGEPTRVHVVQIWQTPLTSAEYAATAPTDGSFLAKVGNAELVRGISDAYTLVTFARNDAPTRASFEELIAATTRFEDAYFWVSNPEAGNLREAVAALRGTTELIIDEFEMVAAIRGRASEALARAADEQRDLVAKILSSDLSRLDAFMHALTELRKQRGKLISLREMREMDLVTVDALENEVAGQFDEVNGKCVTFLPEGDAFGPLNARIVQLLGQIDAVTKVVELEPLGADLNGVQEGLTLLSEVVAGLVVDDATALQGFFASRQHRGRSVACTGRTSLGTHERVPRFRHLRELRAQVVAREQSRLRLDEYMPRVLSSFVRNRLIDEVYLPLIGANLAKQLGAAGAASSRSRRCPWR